MKNVLSLMFVLFIGRGSKYYHLMLNNILYTQHLLSTLDVPVSAPLRTSSSRRSRTRDHYGTTPHGQYQSWNPDSIILEIFTCGISYYSKGRYTRGVLLLEHAPGSFCTCQYTQGSVFKFAQFAPGACSQIFNRLNIVEHFAGWKFCSRR